MSGLTETNMSQENILSGKLVEATLNYFAESSEKPLIYTYDPPPGIPRSTGKSEPHSVLIRNARLEQQLSLDHQGFQLLRHETAVHDFYDRAEVERVYYPEIEVLLKQATGAEKVVIFDHQVRNIQLFRKGEKQARDYGLTVHNDYTATSGPRRVRDHLPPEEAEQRLQNRFAEINVWRPIRGPVESWPLAVCDALSIESKDFVPADFVYRDKVGEVYRFTYNPKHRWFYFPRLERNEAILLKCYDSKEDGRAQFSAHTAFDDPTSGSNAAPRESIEVRALVFWRAVQ
jgi:hypothetical protein